MAVRRSFVICCSNSLGVTPNWRLNISIPKPSVILPVIFSDNYFTLRPGETKTVELQWLPEFTTFSDIEWQHSEY